MAALEVYPPADAYNRAVLVRNITAAATGAAIDDFFSFCGAIESKKVRTIPPARGASAPSLEAVVIFADDAARNTALMMNDSIIVDQPVTIVSIPSGYNFNASVSSPRAGNDGTGDANGNNMLGDIGGFFSAFTSTVSSEWSKAAGAIDRATETGVLRTAKDSMRDAQARTMEIASEIDDRYHVKNTLLNAAEAGKSTANALVEQTRSIASQVDSTYHISEKTTEVLENPAVKNAQRSITTGFQAVLQTAGLEPQADTNGNGVNGTHPDEASPAPPPPANSTNATTT